MIWSDFQPLFALLVASMSIMLYMLALAIVKDHDPIKAFGLTLFWLVIGFIGFFIITGVVL